VRIIAREATNSPAQRFSKVGKDLRKNNLRSEFLASRTFWERDGERETQFSLREARPLLYSTLARFICQPEMAFL